MAGNVSHRRLERGLERAASRARLGGDGHAPSRRDASAQDGVLVTPLDDNVLTALTKLDDQLVNVLQRGDIALLRASWLRVQPDDYRLQRRQDLAPAALLDPTEAAVLVRRGSRSVGVASHGWLTAGNPDPTGHRIALLRRALAKLPHLEALFFDFSSLYQLPRSAEEQEAFERALGVMGDLYASLVGTTVLQIKEIPARPVEYDGYLTLFGVGEAVEAAAIRLALEPRSGGTIVECTREGKDRVVVRFAKHAEARTIRRLAEEAAATCETPEAAAAAISAALKVVCAGADTRYNERSYDGRTGEAAERDDDHGRGWCACRRRLPKLSRPL